MTDLEERLREDLKRLSERAQPDSIRPLRDPLARGRSRAVRWLAAVAAVAAVLSVIAGVSLASHSATRQSANHEGPGRMPPYYVIVQNGHVGLDATVIVRDSATGRVLATLRMPFLVPGGAGDITGAADDRTFVLNDGYELFRLRLAADGRSARLSRLPIALSALDNNVALSPDGSTVAIESQTCKFVSKTNMQVVCRYSAIRLISLRTGATRTWNTRVPAQTGIWISWAGNTRILFSWVSARATSAQPSGYRLLDVAGRGGGLLSARMLPLPPPPVFHGYFIPEPVFISPDGRAVIAATLSTGGPSESPTVIMKIVERSARTGRLLRVLLEAREHNSIPILFGNEGCWVDSLGSTGIHALIECSSPKVVFGRWGNGRFTPLPGMPVFSAPAAW